jgi:hypothetical protein
MILYFFVGIILLFEKSLTVVQDGLEFNLPASASRVIGIIGPPYTASGLALYFI